MIFQIKDQDPKQPMVETHFFKWLLKNGSENGHTIKDKANYLVEQGFIYGEDKLKAEDLQTLKYIHQHFYYLKREGKLPAENEHPIYVSGYDADVEACG